VTDFEDLVGVSQYVYSGFFGGVLLQLFQKLLD